MYSAWTQHLNTEKEKEEFKDRLIRNRDLFEVQSKIIENELNTMENVELSPKAFETPSWSHKQAFFNGYKACSKVINKLNDLR